jgi:hypothetical protein
MMNLGLAQAAGSETDLWSKLLGFDRVQIPSGAEVSVTWHHMPPPWVLFLVIVPALLVVVGGIYRQERRDVSPAVKVVLTLLRGLALLLVLLLLMGPVLTVETIKSRKAFILVLLDESRSMQKSDPLLTEQDREKVAKVTGAAGQAEVARVSRAEIVRKVLENPRLRILDDLEEKLNVAYFTFSSTASGKESRKALLDAYTPQNAVGTETAIGDSIKAALNSLRGQYIAGVVVFTDGRSNSGIAVKEIAAQCKQRYLPVYTIPPGLPHSRRDIALLELEARDHVLANDGTKVSFKVRSTGYPDEQVNVGLYVHPLKEGEKEPGNDPKELQRLVEQSKREEERAVRLKDNDQKQDEFFDYRPKTPGDYLLILRVDPRVDEIDERNNYLKHRIRVADDKIKVLYVEHPPRYEYRFLKNALVRDTKILAHCFLTSADEGFPQEHTKSDDPLFRQPLTEFPRDLKSLLEFDVIIFGDVDPSKLGPDAPKNIEAFVTEFGGGIIFLSGMTSNPRQLANTPLANLLPVIVDETRDPFEHDKVFSEPFGYHLTPDGRTHPILNYKEFQGNLDRNLEHWEDRTPPRDGQRGVRWFARVKKLKAGASPLVELTGVSGESSRPPLFVTQYAGRGRVFWSATDETWLWRYLVGDYPWFYPFWQQAMYWTREGKLLGARRFRVAVDKEVYTRGEPVKLIVNAYDEKYQLRTDPKLTVYIDPPTGDRIPVELTKDPNRDGYYEGQYTPADTGNFRAWAGDEDESARATAKFVVFIPDREEDNPIIDEKALQELASESSGGRFFPLDQVDQLTQVIQKSDSQLRESKEDDLWDSPLAFLVFALLLTAEWILRKIYRML